MAYGDSQYLKNMHAQWGLKPKFWHGLSIFPLFSLKKPENNIKYF